MLLVLPGVVGFLLQQGQIQPSFWERLSSLFPSSLMAPMSSYLQLPHFQSLEGSVVQVFLQ